MFSPEQDSNLLKVVSSNADAWIIQLIKGLRWSEVTQLCPTLCDPMDCSLPGSSVHGIFQARVLEWVAISFQKSLWCVIQRKVRVIHEVSVSHSLMCSFKQLILIEIILYMSNVLSSGNLPANKTDSIF